MKERDFYSLVSDYITLEKKCEKTGEIEDVLRAKELRRQISQAIFDYEDSVIGNLFTERCENV